MHKALIFLAAVAVSWALPAAAQKPDVTGGTVVASEPGKAAAVRAIKVSAQVVAIDKASRTVTLKGPKGNVVDVVVRRAFKNSLEGEPIDADVRAVGAREPSSERRTLPVVACR